MSTNLLALIATPLLLALVLGEFLVSRLMNRDVYGFRQTLNNLAVAVGQRAILGAMGTIPLFGYLWLEQQVGVLSFSAGVWWHWIVGFLAMDFVMWLRHLLGHRVSFLWAMHSVHHQSHEFNYSTALRLGWLQETTLFSIPLAVLGFPLEMVFPLFIAGNIYQFFLHTELVGKLGILESVFMTPSHHRVHHAVNPQYLDKNHGVFLVLWDKMYGTFVEENEKPIYGVVNGIHTYDPIDNNLSPWRTLWARMKAAPTWTSALMIPFMPPAWTPGCGESTPTVPAEAARTPQRARTPRAEQRWGAALTWTACLVGSLAITVGAAWLHPLLGLGAVVTVLVGLSLSATWLDARSIPSRIRSTLQPTESIERMAA